MTGKPEKLDLFSYHEGIGCSPNMFDGSITLRLGLEMITGRYSSKEDYTMHRSTLIELYKPITLSDPWVETEGDARRLRIMDTSYCLHCLHTDFGPIIECIDGYMLLTIAGKEYRADFSQGDVADKFLHNLMGAIR